MKASASNVLQILYLWME